MPYKFNPFTNTLDYYSSGSSSGDLTLIEKAEPADPAEGGSILWRATNGDIMAKSTEGGVTKTATIFPYSILS